MQRLFDMATKIYAAIPIDHVIDEHTAIPPRMPWIVDYSRFGNMGISSSSCITRNEIIKDSKTGSSLRQTSVDTAGDTERRQRLGGLLNYYYRAAA